VITYPANSYCRQTTNSLRQYTIVCHLMMVVWSKHVVALTSEKENKTCCVRQTHNCFLNYTHATGSNTTVTTNQYFGFFSPQLYSNYWWGFCLSYHKFWRQVYCENTGEPPEGGDWICAEISRNWLQLFRLNFRDLGSISPVTSLHRCIGVWRWRINIIIITPWHLSASELYRPSDHGL
jgi:uncharacterized protein (DUF2237 family)